MNRPSKNKMYIWLIAAVTFVLTYVLIHLIASYEGIFVNTEDNTYMNVFFEIGIALFSLLIVGITGYYLSSVWEKKNITPQNLLAISILMVGTLCLSFLMHRFSPYALPIIIVPLILTFITNRRTADIMTLIMTISLMPFYFAVPVVFFMNLFTGVLASSLASKINQRREFPVLGIALAISNILVLFIFNTIAGFKFDEFLINALITGVITFGCVIMTIGLLPFFETISGIISSFQLMDLANPTNKLLKRLTVEAPGTYYHSIMVGNLAEAAAEKVGANALLARVAAYYHDVGKLKDPTCFMENQHGENVHDDMDPYESANIIISHTEDGVKIAQKYKLPPQIIEIIGQHHGNTIVACFYKKACDMAVNDMFVNEEDFKYKSEKPSSKEAAIIMLADSVEAATKALADKSSEKIKQRIDTVVSGKIANGQLDNCGLTLNDISVIKEQFFLSVSAYYHKRDEYPDAKERKWKINV